MLKATDGNTTVYYTRGFELISRREGSAASYYVYDGSLSVRALTNEAGTVTDTLIFDAFGNETGRTETTDNPYGFQGEEQDVTGLYYLRARYMDPATGTFTTMDTYGGNLSDPMSLHKYLFANSNPVMYSDPSGHSTSLSEAAGVCAIIGALSGAFLYDLGFLRNEAEPKTIWGYLTYAIVGAIIAVILFFAIYFLARFIVFIIGLFSVQPDKTEYIIDEIEEGISKANTSYSNNVSDLLDNYRWVQGDTVREKLLQLAQSNKVYNIVNQLYRETASIGDGGTADALIIDGSHYIKVVERIAEIEYIFNSQEINNFTLTDRDILEALYYDLLEALMY